MVNQGLGVTKAATLFSKWIPAFAGMTSHVDAALILSSCIKSFEPGLNLWVLTILKNPLK